MGRQSQVKGGLANAVKQAEERNFEKLFIFDCDAHQQEPFVSFAAKVGEPYSKLAKTMLLPDPETDASLDPWFAKTYRGSLTGSSHVSYYIGPIRHVLRPETAYPHEMSAKDLVNVFTRLMHDIGIKQSIVLPTPLLDVSQAKPDFAALMTRAYVEYMLENFLGTYPEILTLLPVPMNSPIKAAEMIDEFGNEKGVAGVMLSGNSLKPAGSDDLDAVYQAAQQKELAICVHGGRTLSGEYKEFKFLGAHGITFPLSLVRHSTSIVLSGVPERFHKLKFVMMEGGVGWIPWIMNRLDDEYLKRRFEAPLLKRLPSEYFKEFYYSSQPLEQAHVNQLEPIFRMLDFENHMLYSSDYPHWDFDVPSVIYDLPFLSKSAKEKILGKNALNVFRLK